MSTYNPSIPMATDLISNSQSQILANFGQLNTQFGVDHIPFNTGSGNGDGTHKKITFDNAPTEPTPTGTISNVFPLLVGSNQELFFKNASTEYSSSGKVQLTGPSSIGSTTNSSGYVTLPGGLLLQWVEVGISGSTGTANWPKAFSVLFNMTIGPTQPVTMNISASSTTSVSITRAGSGASSCYVMAIGK